MVELLLNSMVSILGREDNYMKYEIDNIWDISRRHISKASRLARNIAYLLTVLIIVLKEPHSLLIAILVFFGIDLLQYFINGHKYRNLGRFYESNSFPEVIIPYEINKLGYTCFYAKIFLILGILLIQIGVIL